MLKSELKKLINEVYIDIISEERLPAEFASYEVKKERIIAYLERQKATAFTKYAKAWTDLDAKVKALAEKKVELNELKNSVEATKDELHSNLRNYIVEIFDIDENMNTLVVDCASSTFTLSKKSEENDDTIIAAHDIVNKDYKKAWDTMYEIMKGDDGIIKKMEELIAQCSEVVRVGEQVTKGKERRLKTDLKDDNSFSKLIKAIKSKLLTLVHNFSNWFKKYEVKIDNYDSMITAL